MLVSFRDSNGTYVKPVNVFVPVRLGDGRIGDVRLLRIVLGVAVGLAGRSHGRLLVDELRLDGEVARHSLRGRHGSGVKRRRGYVGWGDGESKSRRV